MASVYNNGWGRLRAERPLGGIDNDPGPNGLSRGCRVSLSMVDAPSAGKAWLNGSYGDPTRPPWVMVTGLDPVISAA
jgi:hypothetical protein